MQSWYRAVCQRPVGTSYDLSRPYEVGSEYMDPLGRVFEALLISARETDLAKAFWDPREVGEGWTFYRLRPTRIQAYRGYDELEGRDVMRGSAWLA